MAVQYDILSITCRARIMILEESVEAIENRLIIMMMMMMRSTNDIKSIFNSEVLFFKRKMSSVASPGRFYLNVRLDDTLQTRIRLRGIRDWSDLRRAIKGEFEDYIPAPSGALSLELDDGSVVEALSQIPQEYFWDPTAEDSVENKRAAKVAQIKWKSPPKRPARQSEGTVPPSC
jgi:hypothetical protein